jgi:hypothetical protein
VLFEESILSILPAAIFIILATCQVLLLLRRRTQAKRNILYACKLIALGLYTALQLILLVATSRAKHRNHVAIASAAVSLLSGLSLASLSHMEHVKSIRPSFLISFYLVVTVLFDISRVRTQWLGRDHVVAATLTASLTIKFAVLSMEAMEKRSLLGIQKHSVESTSGFINRSLFWWLNSLLKHGFKHILSLNDLPGIHEKLDSDRLGNKLKSQWDACKYAASTTFPSIAYTNQTIQVIRGGNTPWPLPAYLV